MENNFFTQSKIASIQKKIDWNNHLIKMLELVGTDLNKEEIKKLQKQNWDFSRDINKIKRDSQRYFPICEF